jgi:hypothetical protein
MPTACSTPAAAGAPAAYDGFDCMLLNGRWTHGGSGQSVEDVDPYTNEVLLRIRLADDMSAAVDGKLDSNVRIHGLQGL